MPTDLLVAVLSDLESVFVGAPVLDLMVDEGTVEVTVAGSDLETVVVEESDFETVVVLESDFEEETVVEGSGLVTVVVRGSDFDTEVVEESDCETLLVVVVIVPPVVLDFEVESKLLLGADETVVGVWVPSPPAELELPPTEELVPFCGPLDVGIWDTVDVDVEPLSVELTTEEVVITPLFVPLEPPLEPELDVGGADEDELLDTVSVGLDEAEITELVLLLLLLLTVVALSPEVTVVFGPFPNIVELEAPAMEVVPFWPTETELDELKVEVTDAPDHVDVVVEKIEVVVSRAVGSLEEVIRGVVEFPSPMLEAPVDTALLRKLEIVEFPANIELFDVTDGRDANPVEPNTEEKVAFAGLADPERVVVTPLRIVVNERLDEPMPAPTVLLPAVVDVGSNDELAFDAAGTVVLLGPTEPELAVGDSYDVDVVVVGPGEAVVTAFWWYVKEKDWLSL